MGISKLDNTESFFYFFNEMIYSAEDKMSIGSKWSSTNKIERSSVSKVLTRQHQQFTN